MTRKDFFHELARYFILAALAILSGAAWIKSRNSSASAHPLASVCQGCSKAGRCNEKPGPGCQQQ